MPEKGLLNSFPRVTPVQLNLLVGVFFLLAFNRTFWSIGYRLMDGNIFDLFLFGFGVCMLTQVVLAFFGFRYLQKPILIFLLLVGAAASYYVDTLGAVIDREMIQNILTTTFAESKHLVTPGYVLHMAVFGVSPSVLVAVIPVKRAGFVKTVVVQSATAAMALVLCVGALLVNLKTYSVILRGNKELMRSYQPGAPLNGLIKYATMVTKAAVMELQPRGRDAVRVGALAESDKPVLTVIVAGETVRSQNLGLAGYERNTTPELSNTPNLVAFTDVQSCGTATAVSLPCMFSRFDRQNYSYEKGLSNENLLDIVNHAGVKVEWWDNNTGDKDIAARLPTRSYTHTDDPENCAAGECRDGVFLDPLAASLISINEDTTIVLHMIGSHGPAYDLRYPEEFRKFTPVCGTPELKNCSDEEIRNSYDNSILYTDHVVSQIIQMLQNRPDIASSLVYVSDHGESLGENGLYLHGAPYFMAPETQTTVPMLFWFSDSYLEERPLDLNCLKDRAEQPASHANLFHSVLGLWDIETIERQAEEDLIGGCQIEEKDTPS
ncbi:phosphoethanolamine--lipid A transferase [Ruegeria sp. ANG-R]|uniref:phosphoethanolamine transferase n=1 Tax=Ruegeria sp. ANG-R TaxID=1577903 RepID=UPI0009E57C02|nr:phosphoethanolamine--lipid A transferase [Ruegeria sp. ANG-R]